VILRLHDRSRYDPGYLADLEALAAAEAALLLKYKDRERDNLLDLLVADLMISNFSSILNYFYATGRPSIHIYPVDPAHATTVRMFRRGKVRRVKLERSRADFIWKLAPEENGGLLARSFEDMLAAIDTAAADPGCCREASARFLERHMWPADGQACDRIIAALEELAASQPGVGAG
jgi:hypothetical protein